MRGKKVWLKPGKWLCWARSLHNSLFHIRVMPSLWQATEKKLSGKLCTVSGQYQCSAKRFLPFITYISMLTSKTCPMARPSRYWIRGCKWNYTHFQQRVDSTANRASRCRAMRYCPTIGINASTNARTLSSYCYGTARPLYLSEKLTFALKITYDEFVLRRSKVLQQTIQTWSHPEIPTLSWSLALLLADTFVSLNKKLDWKV